MAAQSLVWPALVSALMVVPLPLSRNHAAECTKVIYSAHPKHPPFHGRQGGGVDGASVQFTQQILAELGVPGEARFAAPWPSIQKSAKRGASSAPPDGVRYVMDLQWDRTGIPDDHCEK